MKLKEAQVFVDYDKPMFGLSVKPLPHTTYKKKKEIKLGMLVCNQSLTDDVLPRMSL